MDQPRIVGYCFLTPPGWEPAPEGWLPPEGWTAPVGWPPAPVDWQFYEPIYEAASPAHEANPEAQETPAHGEMAAPSLVTPVEIELSASEGVDTTTEGAHPIDPGFQPLEPLPTRTVPGLGRKGFAESLIREVEEWHSYAGVLKRQIYDRDRQLKLLGALSVAELADNKLELEASVEAITAAIKALRAESLEASAGLADVRDRVELANDGLYAYQHPAESSLDLQTRLVGVQSKIKEAVRAKRAVHSNATFTFNGSAVEGRRWVDDISKLMLRAFNAEAENCVKTVRAGNLAAAQKRLSTAVGQIAKLGVRMGISIDHEYQNLRMQELQIAAEYQERVKEERDLERERREELREAARAEKELNAEREKLERERQQYLTSAAKLDETGDLEGAARIRSELARIDEEIASVDFRAANIRAGHVYVISNVGAFGERMVKIGMTRRLEPKDRIRELGDASVPFRFDTHALIFSNDAVTLETRLHQALATKRVNQINLRREFFYATPAEVKELLREVTSDFKELVEFNEHADADEFRLSTGNLDTAT